MESRGEQRRAWPGGGVDSLLRASWGLQAEAGKTGAAATALGSNGVVVGGEMWPDLEQAGVARRRL